MSQPQQPQLGREPDFNEVYAGQFALQATPEEVFLNLASTFVPGATPKAPPMLGIHTRVVLSYRSAKRLSTMLGDVVRHYEQTYGELELDEGKRRLKK